MLFITVYLISAISGISAQERNLAQPQESGGCYTRSGEELISKSLFVSNETIFDFNGEGKTVTISGESIRYYDQDPGFGKSARVDWYVDENEDLDLSLTFVSVGGELAIYWRETYQHRRFRQGIVSFSLGEFSTVCEGFGGVATMP